MTGTRFPDSDISGSKPVIGSPKLIADCHVLHRHLTPRHSPYALRSLTIILPLSIPAQFATCYNLVTHIKFSKTILDDSGSKVQGSKGTR
jgi:hypothetical protein